MGVPSEELMNMIKSQRDSATPNGIPDVPTGANDMGISDPASPPMAAPMSTPEPKMGNREAALINVSMAMDLLEQSLPAIGSESAERKQILSSIRSMIGVLGVKKASTAELQPAEILQMLQSLPQAGGASPESKAMMSAPAYLVWLQKDLHQSCQCLHLQVAVDYPLALLFHHPFKGKYYGSV